MEESTVDAVGHLLPGDVIKSYVYLGYIDPQLTMKDWWCKREHFFHERLVSGKERLKIVFK